ncbi:MAG: riboflavin synthase [Deltaproteobacteria bacterium]|jgi:riboflavin synthase|nr:riboflavin synthase [Deltaproteobacteria bacterium]
MFTGIALGLGQITSRKRQGSEFLLTVESHFDWDSPLVVGESIAVSGVCLTVTQTKGPRAFQAFASKETLSLTTLASQDLVNLERALRLTDRLGGHLVTGHVDALATLFLKASDGHSLKYVFSIPSELSPLVVTKGSVALDGISLTVNLVTENSVTVNLIPHTLKLTTLASKHPGQTFNLEVDILGRYVKRLLEGSALMAPSAPSPTSQPDSKPTSGLTIEDLMARGF